MSKLILGSAEFDPRGYNGEQPLNSTEIGKIICCAREAGINIIDTAESYGCQSLIKEYAKGFCIYTKTRDWKVTLDWGDNELRGILYHYKPGEGPVKLPFVHRWVNLGVSVYDKAQLPEPMRILQIPFSIENNTFMDCFDTHRTVFIRSVFNRGEALRKYTIQECLQYVEMYRPDGIIVGVRSVKELDEILKGIN